MENEMYRQAIIDAKALRASAIANAKASLQEAFEPKIQEMLRMKLSEEMEEEGIEEDIEEGKEEVEEGYGHTEEGMQEEGYGPTDEGMEEEDLSEGDLDEILAELEAMEEGDDQHESLNEAEDDDSEGDEEESEGDDDMGGEMEPGLEDETDEMEVTIKFGELKDLLTPFVTEPEEGGDEAGAEDMPAPEGDDEGGAGDLSLDEILSELEKEEEGKKVEEAKGQVPGYGKVGGKGTTGYDETVGGEGRTGYDAGSKKLHEANKTIKILSEKLQEINLLNAKLLYMNKIFKAKSLSESQKVRVVKSFDKATSVKEVKNTYEILSEAFSNRSKAPLKESVGFASKPTGGGIGTKKPIVESDPTVDRWQQLVFGNK